MKLFKPVPWIVCKSCLFELVLWIAFESVSLSDRQGCGTLLVLFVWRGCLGCLLQDEIVKNCGAARAIRDVEDEELMDFFVGMSPWQVNKSQQISLPYGYNFVWGWVFGVRPVTTYKRISRFLSPFFLKKIIFPISASFTCEKWFYNSFVWWSPVKKLSFEFILFMVTNCMHVIT